MIAAGRSMLHAHVENQGIIIARIIDETPAILTERWKLIETEIIRQAKEFGKGNYDIESTTYHGFYDYHRMDDNPLIIESFYKSMVVLTWGYFENSLKLILSEFGEDFEKITKNRPNGKSRQFVALEYLKNEKGFSINIEEAENIDTKFRPFRNAIAHGQFNEKNIEDGNEAFVGDNSITFQNGTLSSEYIMSVHKWILATLILIIESFEKNA